MFFVLKSIESLFVIFMIQQMNLDFETCLGWKGTKTVYAVCSSAKSADTRHVIVFHLNRCGCTGLFADVSAPPYAVWYSEILCS